MSLFSSSGGSTYYMRVIQKSQSQGSGQGGHKQVLWLISHVYSSTFSKVRSFWQIAQTSLYLEAYLTLQPRHQLHPEGQELKAVASAPRKKRR